MNDLILSQMRQRLEILYQMVNELEESGGGSGGDSYTKAQTDRLLGYKADKSSTYTKTEVNSLLNGKANTSDVNELFATDDITISEGQTLSSDLSDWLRLHKPLNINGTEFYFSEESGVDYVYKAIDEVGLLPKFITLQIMKSNLQVHFYDIETDVVPADNSINLITSGAVYEVKENVDNLETLTTDNRAALIEIIDSGAKNKLNHSTTTQTLNGITFTVNSDGTIVANGTASSSAIIRLNYFSNLSLPNGNYVLSGCPSGGSANSYRLDITRSPGSSLNDIGNSVAFTVGGSYTPNEIRLVILSGTVCNNLTFKPMISTKAEWDISQTYQPYRPSYQELYERVVALENA